MYVLLACIGVAMAIWAYGLWRQGFFSPRTPNAERRAYAVRVAFWITSIVIVSWPLQIYRSTIGDTAYVLTALAILVLFFALGAVLAKAISKPSKSRRNGA